MRSPLLANFRRIHMVFALGLCLPLTTALAQTAQTASATTPAKSTSSDAKDMKEIAAPVAENTSPLSVRVGLPAWATAISGQVGARGAVSDIGYISFSDIVNHLDYVVPGSIGIDYGKWSFLLEGQYAKLHADFSAPVGPLKANYVAGSIEMDQALADFNLGYKVVDTDKVTLAPFIGTRFQYVELNGSLQGSGPGKKSFSENGSDAWADPVLGFQARCQVFKPMAIVAKADVGGFDAASKLTYQLYLGPEVQLTRSLYLTAGYRYLYTDYTSGGFTYKVDTSGPQIMFGMNF